LPVCVQIRFCCVQKHANKFSSASKKSNEAIIIFVALILSTLITFATSAILSKVIAVIITMVVIHLIDSNIILPIAVGSKVRINGLITVLGVINQLRQKENSFPKKISRYKS